MKILIVGAGATGGYFGARLADAGRDVTFLVREQRAAFLQQRGLRVAGLEQELRIEPKVLTAGALGEVFDVVLLTVKAAGLKSAIADLAPAVGPDTLIVPFLNGLAHMDALAAAFGADKVLGSVVHLVGTINGDGDIAILQPLARWTLGEQGGGTSARLERLLAAISVPGIDVIPAPSGLDAMWQKWVFIVAAGVVTCLMRGPVGDIAAADGGAAFVADVVAETAAVAAGAGFEVPASEQANTLEFLTQPGSSFTSSLYRDVTAGLPNEGEHIVGDFVRRARALGVATPLIDLALLQLRVHGVGAGAARR
ncbi:2-dehydropantoate 2-reductase [Arthrobacter sp. PAMC 25486]|uniref:2-dehydropantoate 2-reductase n=1 Tax=Arthrobacter sp. PAMC 25486 TaxID=1494608 RepID=UPI000535F284|nr:2-dehydropantoate 2-reductase [Arthrobacter sp. PAMC 25486]AIY02795.1 2-dehydropantoate 2-reductase [Arthrobacter sp. PAMC 25486]